VPAASVPRSGISASRSFAAGNWVIVAPREGWTVNTPARLDMLRGNARRVSRVAGPPGRGATVYPWAVSGQYVAAVTGLPDPGTHRKRADVAAYAFRPGGAAVRLGMAIAVFAASEPGRFWIRGDAFGGNIPGARSHHCTVTEVSATGARLGGTEAAPCTRWIIAAVPGGFVSEPTAFPNAARITGLGQISPGSPVQLWSPSGKVVKIYGIKPGWIGGAAGQYLVWQPRSATGPRLSSVQITNLSTAATKRIALRVSAGDVTWRNLVPAPQGRYLAWLEITKTTWRKFSLEATSGAGGEPGIPGSGRVKILDLATGRVVLDRAMTVAWSAALQWSPDDHYLFAASSYTGVSVVPTWSVTAAIRAVQLPGGGGTPDSQQFLVTLRAPAGRG